MKSTPFLGEIPQKFLNDPEVAGFFEYLINYISDIQQDTQSNQTELSQQLNEIYTDDYDLEITDDTEGDDLVFVNGSEFRHIEYNGGSHEVLAFDFVGASSSAVLQLPAFASDNDLVKIANTDGSTIAINGNLVVYGENTSQALMTQKGSVYDFRYSATKQQWVFE